MFAVENLDENPGAHLKEFKQAIDNFLERYKTMNTQLDIPKSPYKVDGKFEKSLR